MIEQESLLTALRTVKDPELNVNVVDLGLDTPLRPMMTKLTSKLR